MKIYTITLNFTFYAFVGSFKFEKNINFYSINSTLSLDIARIDH